MGLSAHSHSSHHKRARDCSCSSGPSQINVSVTKQELEDMNAALYAVFAKGQGDLTDFQKRCEKLNREIVELLNKHFPTETA